MKVSIKPVFVLLCCPGADDVDAQIQYLHNGVVTCVCFWDIYGNTFVAKY